MTFSRRLAIVRRELSAALLGKPPGVIQVTSMCAGQGRDVIPVVAEHPRRSDVSALLIELDPRNCAAARSEIDRHGLEACVVREADAGLMDAYDGVEPADVLLVCGVFGNISDDDIQRTIHALPSMCAAEATVIWTRHRQEPDVTPLIREAFAAEGFSELAFHTSARGFAVGVETLTGSVRSRDLHPRLFTFVGFQALLGEPPP